MRSLILVALLSMSGCGSKISQDGGFLIIPAYNLAAGDQVIIDVYDLQVGLECDSKPTDPGVDGAGECKINYDGEETEVELTTGEKFIDVIVVENGGDILCGQSTVRLWPNLSAELTIEVSRDKCCNLVDYLGQPKDFDPVAAYCESLIND